MNESTMTRTSATLLGRIRDPGDQAAWVAFVERYGRMLYAWCRGHGLQDADAEDVTQELLTSLAHKLRWYDPARGKFRTWLRAVTRNAAGQLKIRQARQGRPGGEGTQELLAAAAARDDLADRLQQEFDLEMLEIARQRVAQRVDPRTMEAFQLTAVEGLPGEEAAARLGMKVATIYMARSRVQKLLREELQQLDEQG